VTDRDATLIRRIDLLESLDAIRQLAAKYSLALDMRDSDAWVNLFPDDVEVDEGRSGRAALPDWFDATMSRQFDGTGQRFYGALTGNRRRRSHPRRVQPMCRYP